MYEGDGLDRTGNKELDYEILRWFNDRMVELVNMYIDIGNDTGWDEDYFMFCFPRNFVEDNFQLCKQIVLDIRDILISNIVYGDIRLLYKYVLYNIIIDAIDTINDSWEEEFEESFCPMSDELVQKIYKQANYVYKSGVTEEQIDDDYDHPFYFIRALHSEDIFYDVIFDDTEFDIDECDRWVMYCTQKIRNKEWQPYDISDVLELASRPVKEAYDKACKESTKLDLSDEMFIVQEIDSAIKLLCNRIKDIECMSENEISNYIEYMLKRLLYLNRNIEIEREALLGFASVNIGEADMILYRNNGGYENIAVIENKFYNPDFKEIKQLLGYLNIYFKFGVTITINDKRKLGDVMEAIYNYLLVQKENIHVVRIEKIGDYILRSTIQNPEDSRQINCYHFILNLNMDDRKEWARIARK